MAFDFASFIDLPPIPAGEASAARQAVAIQRKVDAAGSVAQGIEQAVDAIYAVRADDPPTELGRLRLLYQSAYSRAELETLVANTLDALHVTEPV